MANFSPGWNLLSGWQPSRRTLLIQMTMILHVQVRCNSHLGLKSKSFLSPVLHGWKVTSRCRSKHQILFFPYVGWNFSPGYNKSDRWKVAARFTAFHESYLRKFPWLSHSSTRLAATHWIGQLSLILPRLILGVGQNAVGIFSTLEYHFYF